MSRRCTAPFLDADVAAAWEPFVGRTRVPTVDIISVGVDRARSRSRDAERSPRRRLRVQRSTHHSPAIGAILGFGKPAIDRWDSPGSRALTLRRDAWTASASRREEPVSTSAWLALRDVLAFPRPALVRGHTSWTGIPLPRLPATGCPSSQRDRFPVPCSLCLQLRSHANRGAQDVLREPAARGLPNAIPVRSSLF